MTEHVDKDITRERINVMKKEQSINITVEIGIDCNRVIEAMKILEFRQSKRKFHIKPLYCQILKI